MQIQWTEVAAGDLESIASFIKVDDPGAALRQVPQIMDVVENLLAHHPALGRPGRVPGTRELIIAGTSYIVAYRVRRNQIQVLRVLHGARKWPEQF